MHRRRVLSEKKNLPLCRDQRCFFFPIHCIDKDKNGKKMWKWCKYAKDRLLSFKTVASKMWKAPATFRKVQFPITETFRPGRVLKIQRENHRWSLQPCIGPKAGKNDTIKFGRPICNSWCQCSSIYYYPDINVLAFISNLRLICNQKSSKLAPSFFGPDSYCKAGLIQLNKEQVVISFITMQLQLSSIYRFSFKELECPLSAKLFFFTVV